MKSLHRTFNRLRLLPLLVLFVASASAQQTTNPDVLFQQARSAAFSGEYARARSLCQTILRTDPSNLDALVLVARTYGWEQEFDSARVVIREALRRNPDYLDAITALIDIELWSGHADQALAFANAGVAKKPDYPDFLWRKSEALARLGEKDEAVVTLERLLAIKANHEEGRRFLAALQERNEPQWVFGAGYAFDSFKRETPYGPWHVGNIQVSHLFSFGRVEPRLNYASRDFGAGQLSGWQLEVDAYPKLTQSMYLYINLGYSPDIVFPRSRVGLEWYFPIAGPFEGSLGARYYDFKTTSSTLFTGTLGRYAGSWWFALRPFVTSRSSVFYATGIAIARWYFFEDRDYLSLIAGLGSSPSDVTAQGDVQRLSSTNVGVELKWSASPTTQVQLYTGYEREEYLRGKKGDRFSLSLELFVGL